MKEKVAIATVHGKAYFLIVNELRAQNISFISLVPGETVPPRVKLVIPPNRKRASLSMKKS